jgi:hypothetical protein
VASLCRPLTHRDAPATQKIGSADTISSAEFLHQYQSGQMGDAVEFVGWVGRYKLYLNLKQAISNAP